MGFKLVEHSYGKSYERYVCEKDLLNYLDDACWFV